MPKFVIEREISNVGKPAQLRARDLLVKSRTRLINAGALAILKAVGCERRLPEHFPFPVKYPSVFPTS
jgi:hypothetical protein